MRMIFTFNFCPSYSSHFLFSLKKVAHKQKVTILGKYFNQNQYNYKSYNERGKVQQMQSMQLCILRCKELEETFGNAQWRKVEQMQPM